MTDSVFQTRTLSSICDEIRTVYLNDSRPWILGFSGGKDSTCMAQLVWQALSILPLEKLDKKIYIVSSDTLVESPQIVERITTSLDKIEKASKESNIPISTNLLRPPITDTFWVRILGLGYPAPTSMFRWCTDMLKIANADRFIKERVSEYGRSHCAAWNSQKREFDTSTIDEYAGDRKQRPQSSQKICSDIRVYATGRF